MRFSRFEIAAAVVTLFVFFGGIAVLFDQAPVPAELIAQGHCRTAAVIAQPRRLNFRIGRTTRVDYEVNGTRYADTLHYNGPRLARGSRVTLCVNLDDPSSFATEIDGSAATSTDLWLPSVLAEVGIVLGSGAFVILLACHQWRYRVDE